MLKSKRAFPHGNANFKLREDLTPLLRELIQDLPSSEKVDYLKSEVFSKFVSSDTAPAKVRQSRAIFKWLCTEMNNEATNDRLLAVSPEYQIIPGVQYQSFMSRVQSIVIDVIGESVPEKAVFGLYSSGASTSRVRTESHSSDKYTGKAHITERAIQWFDSLLSRSQLLYISRRFGGYQIVDSNVMFTVPKNTEIDRCACKEPDFNMYLQKGVGNVIRNCLRRVGIDLNDQSRNQSLARIGSLNDSLATLDLSSASDSICREFVFQALPIAWFTYLDDIRCHSTVIPDQGIHVNQMFSSMGNGFTFELESLLFYAVAKATAYFTGTPGTISVYGDDIIVPTQMYQDLIIALEFLGFSVNTDKSFGSGTFRESCGGHYISGRCVTPFYIRKPIETLHDLICIANAIRKWSSIDLNTQSFSLMDSILDEDGYRLWCLLATKVPKCFWGGYDVEDNTRLVSFWKPHKSKRLVPKSRTKRTGLGGYLFWHNLKELSPNAASVRTSTLSVFTGRFRSLRVTWDEKVAARIFASEILEDMSPG